MASRLITRGRRHLFDRPDAPFRPTFCLSILGHGRSSQDRYTGYANQILSDSVHDADKVKESQSISAMKEEHWGCGAAKILQQPPVCFSTCENIGTRFDISLPLGARYFLQSVRTATTATAGQPTTGRADEENEDQNQKQSKEPSPEECDQAVEGLSTAKAKAKAKQLQGSQKDAKRPLQRFWARLLGIGPALRAIASMSRCSFVFFFFLNLEA